MGLIFDRWKQELVKKNSTPRLSQETFSMAFQRMAPQDQVKSVTLSP